MPFARHAPFARVTSLALALSALALAAIPSLTSPLAELSAHHVPGCADRIQTRLFFGLHGPVDDVSDPEWERFLADVVTPRFPDGLTVFRATGQWRGNSGQLEHEPSRVVEIFHDDSPDASERLHAIVQTYKTRYQQESVLVTRAHADVCW